MRIAVVGGGITGLAAAHRLLELAKERGQHVEVSLLEGGDHLGGVISTRRDDGFVLENGPDAMITDKPWGLALARRLGLQDELMGTQDAHRRSFVVRNGTLMPVPEGFQLLAPSRFGPLVSTPIFSWPGKLRMALDLLIPRRTDDTDESLGHFVQRRLGQEALDRMAQPMIAGIYGADPMKLSLKATLPRFGDMEREHGSVIRGMWARMRTAKTSSATGVSGARYGLFVSFRNGVQTLTDALAARLPGGCVSLNTRVEKLERRADGGWMLSLSTGEVREVDAVIVALPAYAAGALLRDLAPRAAELLEGVPYASCSTMSLSYRREDVGHALNGFGFVVPSLENLTLMGCTFSHVKYAHRAPEGVALLRAFIGDAATTRYSDAELQELVRKDLRKLLGITVEPQFVHMWRHNRSMPQYAVGHLDRVAEIEAAVAAISGLELAGNAYRGVGIPDCVHSAENAAERVLAA